MHEQTLKDSELVRDNTQKYGKAPRYFGQKREPRIDAGTPSCGVVDRNKSNESSRKYGVYPQGKRPRGVPEGYDYEG